ncbi:MAG TPA: fluoride efflux transporter CrcB [Candidatus Koribacter sp.]|jgi:CrcB protein
MAIREYLWVSLGGVVGACARYFLSRFTAKIVGTSFPWGTLLINITGSFILGLFLVYTTERVFVDPRWRLLIAIGFCGAYTTFSSYAFESMVYFQQGNWALFAGNVLANNVLCLAAVLAAAAFARAL